MSRSIKVALAVSIAMAAVIYVALDRGRTARATRALHVLPSTTRAVLRIDLRTLDRSMPAQTLFERFIPQGSLSEIESICGFDPVRDLAEVLLWVRGTEREPLQSFGLMLTGKNVDAATIAECHRDLVIARGGEVVRVEAATGPLLTSRDRRSAVGLVDGRTAVTGSVETIAEAMAVGRDRIPALQERVAFASLWSELSPGAVIAAVVEPPEHWQAALARGTAFGEESSAFDGIEEIGLAVSARAGRATSLHLEAATPELAQSSAERIRGWITSPPPAFEPPWDEVLRSGEVTQENRHVTLSVDVSSLAPPR